MRRSKYSTSIYFHFHPFSILKTINTVAWLHKERKATIMLHCEFEVDIITLPDLTDKSILCNKSLCRVQVKLNFFLYFCEAFFFKYISNILLFLNLQKYYYYYSSCIYTLTVVWLFLSMLMFLAMIDCICNLWLGMNVFARSKTFFNMSSRATVNYSTSSDFIRPCIQLTSPGSRSRKMPGTLTHSHL